jgi:hypothetical protein
MKKSLSIVSLVFALALVFSPVGGYAQQSADKKVPPAKTATEQGGHHYGPMGEGHGKMNAEDHRKMMEERRKEMMVKHDEAVAAMKAMDEALDAKVAAMKAAKGDEKMAAMEAVLDLMTTQRKEMRAKMADMQHAGMCCMMMGGKGMRQWGMKGMGDMSSMCPMMKGEGQGAKPEAGAEKVKN